MRGDAGERLIEMADAMRHGEARGTDGASLMRQVGEQGLGGLPDRKGEDDDAEQIHRRSAHGGVVIQNPVVALWVVASRCSRRIGASPSAAEPSCG